MKVAVISTGVFKVPCTGYAGLEHLAWQIARGLAEKGHEVTLMAPEGSYCPNVSMFFIGPERTWDESRAYDSYWRTLPSFDVIIDHTWSKFSYLLKMEGALKSPVLGVMHAPVNTMIQSLPPNVEKPCFVCISKDQKNHFEALFNAEARVAYNGVDLDFYRNTGCRRSHRFLFLARFSTIKAPDIAIEVARKSDVGLDLIGDTSITNEPELYNKCKGACDGEKIRMVGPKTRGECVHWFSKSFALLHPNQRFREPFGLAPVEAMACGTPVIAWKYGAMKETVGEGISGYLCKSVSEMVERVKAVQENFDIRSEVGIRNRVRCVDWVSQFSLQRMIDRYDKLIREAVDAGGW